MISIIIPTYNEAKNIPILCASINAHLLNQKYEVIIVDDNSPDKTWQVAKELSTKFPVRVIRRVNERGLASAVMRGFKEAKGDILGVIDADLSHPPSTIPKLVAALDVHDLAIGSRLTKGGQVEKWPAHRKFISWVARLLARPLTPVKDIMSGFFFIRRVVFESYHSSPRGYKIALDMLVKAKYNSVIEIPITFRNRTVGKSKLGLKVYFDYLVQLSNLYFFKLKSMLNS